MYDELVKRLRSVKDSWQTEEESWMLEAADAIEGLTEDNIALNGTVSNLIQQIAELSKPHWIPVTERLPENGCYVLVCEEDGDVVTADYEDRIGKWFLRDMYEIIELKPTHWMPLPEPPKEET